VEFPRDSGAGRPGVFWYPASVEPKNVTRSNSRTGHLDWIHRSNYEFMTDFKVLKVLFEGKTATGVMYASTRAQNFTETYIVKARKEVIIAAGTIHTPQILQASGIGPKAVLDSANITILVDLPGVGQNFQDHPLPTSARFTCELAMKILKPLLTCVA
jgi:choline dehydrogenase